MRFLLVLLSLLATPFMVSAAQQSRGDNGRALGRNGDQGLGHNDAHCAQRVAQHPGKDINKCEPARPLPPPPVTPPPPPPPPVEPPPPPPPPVPAGTSAIDGRAYNNITGRPGLANWVVTLTGTVNRTAATSTTGTYAFTGLPAGDYVVCLAVQDGWVMTMPGSWGPVCPTGFGYVFTLADLNSASFVNFAVVVAP